MRTNLCSEQVPDHPLKPKKRKKNNHLEKSTRSRAIMEKIAIFYKYPSQKLMNRRNWSARAMALDTRSVHDRIKEARQIKESCSF